LENRLGDPVIRALAGRVEVRESEELNALCRLFEKGDPRGRFASEVKVTLADGRELSSGRVGGGLTFPQGGWNQRVMEEKFVWLVEPLLGAPATLRLLELAWSLDELDGVGELVEIVRGR